MCTALFPQGQRAACRLERGSRALDTCKHDAHQDCIQNLQIEKTIFCMLHATPASTKLVDHHAQQHPCRTQPLQQRGELT